MKDSYGTSPTTPKIFFHTIPLKHFIYSSITMFNFLQSVTLELSPGKVTALVGPSGGGKTSCVGLLQRFYEPQDGEVFLDGEPLYRYQHQYFHQKAGNIKLARTTQTCILLSDSLLTQFLVSLPQVAMVSQDPVLFSGTVRYNIEYGLQDCTIERVKEAARKANAHTFICNLEQGYDTGTV